MDESHWLEQFFGIEVAREVDTDCPQRNVPVGLRRVWRSGLVCRAALPSLNSQRWLPCIPAGERTSCDSCPIQEASLAFLQHGLQPSTMEQWLVAMERSAKRPPKITVWDNGSGNGGG